MTQKILRISSDLKVKFTYLLFVSLLFVCGIFNNAVRVSDYVPSNDRMVTSNKPGNT
jgi:hypothetical protein